MGQSGNKTVETDADVSAFIARIADERQRADAEVLVDVMAQASGHPARMWGPSIIGFGTHRYKYESGREGEICAVGFSPRAGKLVFYGLAITEHGDALARLGKHTTGKGCLYIKRLSDVDLEPLKGMIADAAKLRIN